MFWGSKNDDWGWRRLETIATRIRDHDFYDRRKLIDDLLAQAPSLPQRKLVKFVEAASSGNNIRRCGFTRGEVSALLEACDQIGVSDFGYSVRNLVMGEEQLTTAVLSMLHHGDYYYRGTMGEAVAGVEGVYQLYFESIYSRADRMRGSSSGYDSRLLMITALGQNVKGSRKGKTNDNYVVEIFKDPETGRLLARAGVLINASPEFIAVLSPFDFHHNIEFAEFFWSEIEEVIDTGQTSVLANVAAAEKSANLETLRFFANGEGLSGSYQEGSKGVGAIYGVKIRKGVNDQVLYSGGAGLGAVTPTDPVLLDKITRNLSGDMTPEPREASAERRWRALNMTDGEINETPKLFSASAHSAFNDEVEEPEVKPRIWWKMKRTWVGLWLGGVSIFALMQAAMEDARLAELRQNDPNAYLETLAGTPEYWAELKELFPERYDEEMTEGSVRVMNEARDHTAAYVTNFYADQSNGMREALLRGRVTDPGGTAQEIAKANHGWETAQALIPRGDFDELIEARVVVGVIVACEGETGYWELEQSKTASAFDAVRNAHKSHSRRYGADQLYIWVEAGAGDYVQQSPFGTPDSDKRKSCTDFYPFVARSAFAAKLRSE